MVHGCRHIFLSPGVMGGGACQVVRDKASIGLEVDRLFQVVRDDDEEFIGSRVTGWPPLYDSAMRSASLHLSSEARIPQLTSDL